MGSGCGRQQLHHVGKVNGDPGILPGPSEDCEAVGEWGSREHCPEGGYSQIPGGFSSPAAPPLHQHSVQVLLGKSSLPGSAGMASAGAAVLSPTAEPSTSAPGHAHTWHKLLAGEQLQHLQHIQQHFLSPPGPQPAGIHRQDPGFAPQLFSMRFL